MTIGFIVSIMDWIYTYQYELMYSFGALFALFSMMSYVKPASFSSGTESMDSSENFFKGFDELDLSEIMYDESNDEDNVLPFKDLDSVTKKPQKKMQEEEKDTSVEASSKSSNAVVVEEKADQDIDFEDEVVDYFSQSDLGILSATIQENSGRNQSKQSQISTNSNQKPVVDGFAKDSAREHTLGLAKEKNLDIKPDAFKVKEPVVKKDVLMMKKKESNRLLSKDVLLMHNKSGEFESE